MQKVHESNPQVQMHRTLIFSNLKQDIQRSFSQHCRQCAGVMLLSSGKAGDAGNAGDSHQWQMGGGEYGKYRHVAVTWALVISIIQVAHPLQPFPPLSLIHI